jgi:RNA 2',3'-cyclic 3'-phosphodiesterase
MPTDEPLRQLGTTLIFPMEKRLFIALELPESCRAVLAALDPKIKGLRWISSEQLHATMSFLDRVTQEEEEKLQEALAIVRVPPFFLPIQGVGTFGGSKPTVLWAGLGKAHPHLFALHKHIQDAVLKLGLEPDLRPFHAHITLGRLNGASSALLKPFLRCNAETEFGLWKVTGFALFSSVLTREGPIHALEKRFNF